MAWAGSPASDPRRADRPGMAATSSGMTANSPSIRRPITTAARVLTTAERAAIHRSKPMPARTPRPSTPSSMNRDGTRTKFSPGSQYTQRHTPYGGPDGKPDRDEHDREVEPTGVGAAASGARPRPHEKCRRGEPDRQDARKQPCVRLLFEPRPVRHPGNQPRLKVRRRREEARGRDAPVVERPPKPDLDLRRAIGNVDER